MVLCPLKIPKLTGVSPLAADSLLWGGLEAFFLVASAKQIYSGHISLHGLGNKQIKPISPSPGGF